MAKIRIFFALWPDTKTRQEISDLLFDLQHLKLKGRMFKPENLHLTLHFLGNVPPEYYSCALDVASDINVKSFDLAIDHYDYFKKARIFWAGPTVIPEELTELHLQLGEALSGCGYQVEKRKFTPHITLMRNVRGFDKQSEPKTINWHINQFALIESVPVEGGVEYRPVKLYQLS